MRIVGSAGALFGFNLASASLVPVEWKRLGLLSHWDRVQPSVLVDAGGLECLGTEEIWQSHHWLSARVGGREGREVSGQLDADESRTKEMGMRAEQTF